jgi:hypothetical protein
LAGGGVEQNQIGLGPSPIRKYHDATTDLDLRVPPRHASASASGAPDLSGRRHDPPGPRIIARPRCSTILHEAFWSPKLPDGSVDPSIAAIQIASGTDEKGHNGLMHRSKSWSLLLSAVLPRSVLHGRAWFVGGNSHGGQVSVSVRPGLSSDRRGLACSILSLPKRPRDIERLTRGDWRDE